MTPQQEQLLRKQAKQRGYDKTKEDAFVQFVAGKGGFTSTPSPVAIAAPQKEGIFKRVGSFLKDELSGANKERGLVGDIVSSTVGSKGLLGVGQLPGKVAGQPGLLKDQTALDTSRAGLAEQNTKLAKLLRTVIDPARRASIERIIKENNEALGIATDAGQRTQEFVTTPRQAISTSANAALTALTGSGSAAKSTGIKAAQKLTPKFAPAVTKALSFGKGVLPRAVEQGALGAGFNASSNIANSRPVLENSKTAFALGAAFPLAGTAASKGKQAILNKTQSSSARLINSLIKPLAKDFSYGKNPGRTVAREGIVFNSLEEGAVKIAERRNQIGEEISKRVSASNKTYNAQDVLSPIDEAIAQAKKSPRTNAALIKRLEDTRADLLQVETDASGKIIKQRNLDKVTAKELFEFKKDIADLTKFTGNASDDAAINKALTRSYGNAKGKLNDTPGLSDLNEKYADLSSAEIAIKYRDKVEQRLNLVSLGTKLTSISGVLTGIFSGNPTPAVLGLGLAGMEALLSKPLVKTRVAKWLASASNKEKQRAFQNIPYLKEVIDRIFGGKE
jgi:hypothetical protein